MTCRLFYMLLIIALPLHAPAQIYSLGKEPGRKVLAYHDFRSGITYPKYGYDKIRALIAATKSDFFRPAALGADTLEALSLREQFTYHMIHAESYHQICSTMPAVTDERRKIFAYIPDFFGTVGWSQRQATFFDGHRDSVLALICESTLQSGHMGANFKQVVIDLKASELIPFIIEQIHREPKDHDLLTVLMLLMKDAAYLPFKASPIYKKLYGGNAGYREGIGYRRADEMLIIRQATDFYSSQKR